MHEANFERLRERVQMRDADGERQTWNETENELLVGKEEREGERERERAEATDT